MAAQKKSKTRFSSRAVTIPLISVILLCILSASFLLSSVIYGIMTQDITCPPLLGNRPEVISRLVDGVSDARPFSFLVVGDTKTSNTFEHFYEDIPLETTPDFGVIVGDFVADPEMNRHRFFVREFSEWNMTFPFFLIPGNHDIVTSHIKHVDSLFEPFYPKDFERIYGPTKFFFTYQRCLFIGLNDLSGTGYLDYARDVLSRYARDSLITFIFMHIPPPSLSPTVKGRGVEGEQEFLRLMDEYRVDYVIMGDFHSYFRGDHNSTKYIITGGGGSTLYEGTSRSFHHVLQFLVDPREKSVDEIIYPINRITDLGDKAEIVLLAQLYPLFDSHPMLWAALFSLITLSGLVGMIRLLTMTAAGRPQKTATGKK